MLSTSCLNYKIDKNDLLVNDFFRINSRFVVFSAKLARTLLTGILHELTCHLRMQDPYKFHTALSIEKERIKNVVFMYEMG